MNNSEEKSSEQPVAEILRARLRALESTAERRTLAGIARDLGNLPTQSARAVLETSALIAGVSLRSSLEFLRAATSAAQVLDAGEIKSWGEMGRRLSMGDVETGVRFFSAGVAEIQLLPHPARALLFQICMRQLTLSSSVAIETFQSAPATTVGIKTEAQLIAVYAVAAEISKRSAKHSTEFLRAAPLVIRSLVSVGPEAEDLAAAAIAMITSFALRAGAMAADAWAAIPGAIVRLQPAAVFALFATTESFLERGGSIALHVLEAGGGALRHAPAAYADWTSLLWSIAAHGNAPLVAFVRASPPFFQQIATGVDSRVAGTLAQRVIAAVQTVAFVDAEAALSCFRSSMRALRTASIEQFEDWVAAGSADDTLLSAKARRSYFALETRRSHERLNTADSGLALDQVQQTLRLYVEGLTGRVVEISALSAVPDEARLGDGRVIYLPARVDEFGAADLDFRLYKVLAAHGAGQIEFGTYERDTTGLKAAYASVRQWFAQENADARDAFALSGYIEDLSTSEISADSLKTKKRKAQDKLPPDSDYRRVLLQFPLPELARRIFSTLENGRVDRRLRATYKGLARDLDLTQSHLRAARPNMLDLSAAQAPFELLFQAALCGGVCTDAHHFYAQAASEIESIVDQYLNGPDASVADTIAATQRVYVLFQSVSESSEDAADSLEADTEAPDDTSADQTTTETESKDKTRTDARELFDAWTQTAEAAPADGLTGPEQWIRSETPELPLEKGDVAFEYDEWDRDLMDYRPAWCRVIERRAKPGSPTFVELTRSRYKGIVASIRRQFQMLRPEELRRINNELDGEDYDLNAVVDFVIDRRADGRQSERIYTKRLRRQRDVAVSFLLDQSSSTARTIGRHPLQPYTHPGRRIIDVEKEGLVLMSEALEAVGDSYSISGFTSEGRRNVRYNVIKEFAEKYSDEIEKRIGGLSFHNNTRLGAAIRHATTRLTREQARTKLLIILSDGRPYDHDYGDVRYAREDTCAALRAAKVQAVTPFCITIDRDSESELRELYGEVGYTIIDDILSLPERLPGIYRRLTT